MPKKGDIVLVTFPYSDFSGEKYRPALVIASSGEHAVTLFIASQSRIKGKWNVGIKAPVQTGLSVDSVIRCDKVASFDLRIIQGRIGRAPRQIMRAVDAKLRKLLTL